ncbi:MAG: GAF domain-containing protein [Chloroflexi bacterium]|nr:GAF domain-containing protein [Chloroflexota bacterium]
MTRDTAVTIGLDLLIILLAIILIPTEGYEGLWLHAMYMVLAVQFFRQPGWPSVVRLTSVALIDGLDLLYHGELLVIVGHVVELNFTPDVVTNLGELLGMAALGGLVAVLAHQRRRLLVATQQAAQREAQLREIETKQRAALESVWQHSLAISSQLSLGDVLKAIAESCSVLTGATYGAVAVVEDGTTITQFVGTGWPGSESCGPMPKGLGLLGASLEEKISLRAGDTGLDRPSAGFPPGHPEVTGLLAVPILAGDKVIGRLYVTNKVGAEEFSAEDEGMLRIFASQAAIAIENAQLFEKAGEVEALRELNRLKTEFVSSVSHELRTPLTYLVGYGELLARRSSLPDQVRFMADEIQRESLRLKKIVDDLLDVSYLESGRFVLDRNPASLGDIVQKQIRHFSTVSAQHQIVAIIPPALPMVSLDVVRIGQVLGNLISNAISYSPGGGEVRVSVEEKGEKLLVSVSDQGIGIPKDQLGRVFERFYRGQSDQVLRVRGTGLGLSVVKLLVEAHGGSIGVESRAGAGSTFYFALPVDDLSPG